MILVVVLVQIVGVSFKLMNFIRILNVWELVSFGR